MSFLEVPFYVTAIWGIGMAVLMVTWGLLMYSLRDRYNRFVRWMAGFLATIVFAKTWYDFQFALDKPDLLVDELVSLVLAAIVVVSVLMLILALVKVAEIVFPEKPEESAIEDSQEPMEDEKE